MFVNYQECGYGKVRAWRRISSGKIVNSSSGEVKKLVHHCIACSFSRLGFGPRGCDLSLLATVWILW